MLASGFKRRLPRLYKSRAAEALTHKPDRDVHRKMVLMCLQTSGSVLCVSAKGSLETMSQAYSLGRSSKFIGIPPIAQAPFRLEKSSGIVPPDRNTIATWALDIDRMQSIWPGKPAAHTGQGQGSRRSLAFSV